MGETEADINIFGRSRGNSSLNTVIRDKPVFNPNDLYYDMSGKKYLHIFNHYEYQKTRYFKNKKPSTREGTQNDVSRLTEVFENLGFEVTPYDDKEYQQIIDIITEITIKDNRDTSCLFFAFLTHGNIGGDLYAADQPYQFKDVLGLLEHGHESLVAKPKVIFVQACRGNQMDDGKKIELDGPCASYLIPTHADFLILYSTVEDHRSYRDTNGSFMIQDLCEVIHTYHKSWDLLQLLTLVHRSVAYKRSTYTPRVMSRHNKKQMPETKYTLTKFLRL
ncbi:unnamed protein product [Leptosia nina]|uniref:Uncharacterized protein n=1 Tax=Leptosia nina TaxID=320188 RepID=A0AAV1JLL0_9NEOP